MIQNQAARPKCVLIGASGHAHSVLDAILSTDAIEPVAILTPDSHLWGTDLFGVPITGGDEQLERLAAVGANTFTIAFGALGKPFLRAEAYTKAVRAGLSPINIVHKAAVISPFSKIGEGCQFLAGSIVNPMAQLGNNVLVNTGAIIEHDCIIGDNCFIATGGKLSGNVQLRTNVHIGTGASIRQGLVIGENSIVGVGAAVVKDVPANVVVAGVPAKIIRELS